MENKKKMNKAYFRNKGEHLKSVGNGDEAN